MIKPTQKQLSQARTIEQQLDLILKIQQDRKMLKRQNKALNEKYLKLTQTFKKYTNILKSQQQTMTEPIEHSVKRQSAVQTQLDMMDRGCQVDLMQQQQNYNTLNNTSKLTEAMSFLKAIDTTSVHHNTSRVTNEHQYQFGKTSNILHNQTLRKAHNQTMTMKQSKDGHHVSNTNNKPNNNSQVTTQIVKLSKQMASLKRQLKQSQTKIKQKQKQLKQTKKCLQTKSQALQKTRKQFNQLSMLLNTDKYKSVRNLEMQNQKLKLKATKIDQQSSVIQNLKDMLEKITYEYNSYTEEKQRKVLSLTKQLKLKDQSVEELEIKLGQSRNQLKLYRS